MRFFRSWLGLPFPPPSTISCSLSWATGRLCTGGPAPAGGSRYVPRAPHRPAAAPAASLTVVVRAITTTTITTSIGLGSSNFGGNPSPRTGALSESIAAPTKPIINVSANITHLPGGGPVYASGAPWSNAPLSTHRRDGRVFAPSVRSAVIYITPGSLFHAAITATATVASVPCTRTSATATTAAAAAASCATQSRYPHRSHCTSTPSATPSCSLRNRHCRYYQRRCCHGHRARRSRCNRALTRACALYRAASWEFSERPAPSLRDLPQSHSGGLS